MQSLVSLDWIIIINIYICCILIMDFEFENNRQKLKADKKNTVNC